MNIPLSSDAPVVNCFIQDEQGFIWIGSANGLYSFDGQRSKPHFSHQESTATHIYCGVSLGDRLLCFGSDNGLHIYNTATDRYETPDVKFPRNVRAILPIDNKTMLVGSLDGLYLYDREKKSINNIGEGKLPHSAVYSIISLGEQIYIGTYDGLCRYDKHTRAITTVYLPPDLGRSNRFVNSLMADSARNCIWVGMEGGLIHYDPRSNKTQTIEALYGNSLKALTLDINHNLLVATDNGLYIYTPETKRLSHSFHDSRNNSSLSNNIVWGLFADRDGNMWVGTDNAISLVPNNPLYRHIPIAEITGIGDGNQFYSINRDARGYIWLGGANGLIRTNLDSLSGEWRSVWYRMGDPKHRLPHNRIRDIFVDSNKDLWIASDGSINRYDYSSEQFRRYSITDSTRRRNANWAYKLFEDSKGRLWVSSFLGGIFGIDRSALINNGGNAYVSPVNFTTADGLPVNAVNQINGDKYGGIWALCYPDGVVRYEPKSGRFEPVKINALSDTEKSNFLFSDHEGYVWVGFNGSTVRVDPLTGEQRRVAIGRRESERILSMDDSPNHVWLTTSSGIHAIDKRSLKLHRTELSERAYTSIFYDNQDSLIYAGCSDGVVIFSPEIANHTSTTRPLYLSSLFINNQEFDPQRDNYSESVRDMRSIRLCHNQNNLSFEMADLNYSEQGNSSLLYRLDGFEQEWNVLSDVSARITYNNLPDGKFKLIVKSSTSDDPATSAIYELNIRIRPTWYGTVAAKIVYVALLLGLIAWIINFFYVRHKLRIERVLRDQSLELSSMKMDFFTNVSHELKTPLSMIIAPVNKVLTESKSRRTREQMEIAQRNAMKLNSLIHRILEFNRDGSGLDSGLILSSVEFVGFARSIFESYRESNRERGLEFEFTTTQEHIYTSLDIIKTESVLNNLLSNACKYSADNGRITMSIDVLADVNQMTIVIADNGVGIPENELPYLFGRFYQSSRTVGLNKGTGIGLYLVKNYVQMQGGDTRISSELSRGTKVTVSLPVDENWQHTEHDDTAELPVTSDVPCILIVEDNEEVSSFLHGMLKDRYRLLTAENGRIGLNKSMEHHPDLIISDIMMPVMDGMEMCRRIRAHAPISTTPVILLTAKDDKKTELDSIELGIDAFISKPFDQSLLLSRVKQLLNNKTRIESQVRIENITQPKQIEAVSVDEKFLTELTSLIEERVSDPDLNVGALSSILGISTKQIYRKTKQLTGLSPVDYIRSIRLKKAAMLLSENRFTVSEIMYMVGFSNHSYFSRSFQRELGTTPKKYSSKE